MLDPVGFWSYARHDDQHSDGQLSQLRAVVGKAIGLQYGGEVTLWQDIDAIPFGADWAATIERTIDQTTFFIPIVTPRFLKSQYCFDEFTAFRQRMIALGRDDLIFPVQYVDVKKLQPAETVFGKNLDALRRPQWIDFVPLFYAEPRSAEVRRWAGALAENILDAMRRPAEPHITKIQAERPLTRIQAPNLGESTIEATIGRWLKRLGDTVAIDDALVELETDKVTIEVPAPAAGVLSEIAAQEGETVAPGDLLGLIKGR
jgi:biotin carboxyl carrier protein